jgi:hypothetical protein
MCVRLQHTGHHSLQKSEISSKFAGQRDYYKITGSLAKTLLSYKLAVELYIIEYTDILLNKKIQEIRVSKSKQEYRYTIQ